MERGLSEATAAHGRLNAQAHEKGPLREEQTRLLLRVEELETALAQPGQITCTPDCRGLCPTCGANLNDDPDHAHEAEPDPRWAKLSEIRFE